MTLNLPNPFRKSYEDKHMDKRLVNLIIKQDFVISIGEASYAPSALWNA